MNRNESIKNEKLGIFSVVYNELKNNRRKQIRLLKKYFPIGIEVCVYDNLRNLFLELENNKEKTIVIGYDFKATEKDNTVYSPGLILKDKLEDYSYLINGESIHPGYVFYNMESMRNLIIDKLLK